MMLRHYDNLFEWSLTTSIAEEKDGYYRFEDTIFYGEKGGMVPDRGTINGQRVVDLKWEGDQLFHKVAQPLNNPIHLELDGPYRLMNSQIQSALHLLDGYYRPYNIALTAVSAEPGNQWYQINCESVSPEELAKVESYMQEAILAEIPVSYEYFTGATYPDPAYAQHEEVRVVSFGNLDRQPCGTPHVNHTGQIASFVILGQKKHGNETRIQIAVGLAASHLLKEKATTVDVLREIMNTNEEKLLTDTKELIALKKENKERIKELLASLASFQSQEIAQSNEKIVVNQVAVENMRSVSQNLLNDSAQSKILITEDQGVCHFSIISPSGQARQFLQELQEQVALKGGGSPTIVSGRTEESLEDLMAIVQSKINNLK